MFNLSLSVQVWDLGISSLHSLQLVVALNGVGGNLFLGVGLVFAQSLALYLPLPCSFCKSAYQFVLATLTLSKLPLSSFRRILFNEESLSVSSSSLSLAS